MAVAVGELVPEYAANIKQAILEIVRRRVRQELQIHAAKAAARDQQALPKSWQTRETSDHAAAAGTRVITLVTARGASDDACRLCGRCEKSGRSGLLRGKKHSRFRPGGGLSALRASRSASGYVPCGARASEQRP